MSAARDPSSPGSGTPVERRTGSQRALGSQVRLRVKGDRHPPLPRTRTLRDWFWITVENVCLVSILTLVTALVLPGEMTLWSLAVAFVLTVIGLAVKVRPLTWVGLWLESLLDGAPGAPRDLGRK